VTDPIGLVRNAHQRFKGDRDYDFVYVVCDGDSNQLAAARELAARPLRNASGATTQVQIIASCPCIEFWLLLHFQYSRVRSKAGSKRNRRSALTFPTTERTIATSFARRSRAWIWLARGLCS